LTRSIKRIIFETIHKFHAGKLTTLTVSEIRQIAGRAGRYRTSRQAIEAAKEEKPTTNSAKASNTATPGFESIPRLDADEPTSIDESIETMQEAELYPAPSVDELSKRAEFDSHTVGLVTTIDSADFDIVRQALETEPPALTFATIQPPAGIIQRFASYFPPATPFSYILLRLSELSDTTNRYKIYHKTDMILMADLIHGIEELSTEDRMIFINAPAGIRDRASTRAKLLKELAECIGKQRGGDLLAMKHLDLEVLDNPAAGNKARLKELEELHKGLVLYLWLSFRFPGVFTQRPLANYAKELVESGIEETLRLMTFMPAAVRREKMRKRSKIEDDIMRVLTDVEGKKEGQENAVVAEKGFEESNLENVLDEEVEGGERMVEDDEGEYPDEELETERTRLAKRVQSAEKQEEKSEEDTPTSSRFQSWREKSSQALFGKSDAEADDKLATSQTREINVAAATHEAEKQRAHG
jgi:ATP-dependent RNA helicase SUPV3L1/SUV3